MALDNFIPTVWSARLLAQLEKSLVYGQAGVVNRDYEGEITDVGDTVKINTIGPVTISTYVKNTDMAAPETLHDASQFLEITQAKSFHFQIDDIDKVQQKPKLMDGAMRSAAYRLSDVADQFLAALMAASVPANSTLGLGGSFDVGYGSGDNEPYYVLVTLGQMLDENNVPRLGRWCIVPPWFHAYLQLDARFVGSGAQSADERLVNGQIGTAAGFRILLSNNVPFETGPVEYKVLAGVDMATTYAEQISKVEAYRPERRFGDAAKGLHLYGAKVVLPSALAMCVADVGDPSA